MNTKVMQTLFYHLIFPDTHTHTHTHTHRHTDTDKQTYKNILIE